MTKKIISVISHHKKITCYTGIVIFTVFLNLAAWNSRSFCDAYIQWVFPVWVNTYGRLTGMFPFSVGEWLIAAGVVLVICAVVLAGAAAAAGLLRKRKILCFLKGFYCFFAWVLLVVCLIMTLNCVILYHASTFSEKYFGEDTGEYSLEEFFDIRNMVVEQCNRLSREVEREADGMVHYPGSTLADGSEGDMADKAREVMAQLGKTYAQLDGYYPRPKPLFSSDFMCQQYMQGYYFPFSMEANYNNVMHVMNKPATMCHELAHLRGYIYEDEANFISYLACILSDDIYFQYSGYLSVLNYLENDLYRVSMNTPDIYAQVSEQVTIAEVLPQVREDNIFVEQKEWDRINERALFSTEKVDEVTDTLVDASLKMNGVSDGKVSYSRVVRLLLQYYKKIP